MNPYLRAAQQHPEIKLQAIAALENRQQEAPPKLVRARNEKGRFTPDNPDTTKNEAWVTTQE